MWFWLFTPKSLCGKKVTFPTFHSVSLYCSLFNSLLAVKTIKNAIFILTNKYVLLHWWLHEESWGKCVGKLLRKCAYRRCMIVTQQASKWFSAKDKLLANPDGWHNSTWTHNADAWTDQHMAMTCHDFARHCENLARFLLSHTKYQWMKSMLIYLADCQMTCHTETSIWCFCKIFFSTLTPRTNE
jgi:hypothetical protein